MIRTNGENGDLGMIGNSIWGFLGGLLTIGVLCVTPAAGQSLIYVDANDDFVADAGQPDGFAFGPNANIAPESAFDQSGNVNRNDGLWHLRTAAGSQGPTGDSFIWEATGNVQAGDTGENVPEITQTISGLTPGASYKVYAAYWASDGESWPIRTGVASGNLTLYDRFGTQAGATPGILASSALWTTPPTILGVPAFAEGDRDLLVGLAGTVVADAMGKATVYIDDLPGNSSATRTWFDGVAYLPAAFSPTLDATVNRTTGQISLSNNTGQSIQIVSYSINSAAGALNPNTWLSISGNYDGNDGGEFDTDIWNITAPTMPFPAAATVLSEAEDASGGNTGGALTSTVLNLGNAWIRTPIQDLQISVTLTDATVLTITPTYTGNAIASGDVDADGDIDLTDFDILRINMHTNVSSLTRAQTYGLGDLAGNSLAINFDDFVAFRTAYNAAHGAGAFEAATGVPEPSTIALAAVVLLGGLWLCQRRRRMHWAVAHAALAMCHQRSHPIYLRGGILNRFDSRFGGALRLILACGLVAVGARSARAQITYVDATTSNTTLAAGGAITTSPDANGTDGIWRLRALGNGATVYESGGDISATGSAVNGNNEDAPRWVTKVTGLMPNETYSAFAYFWSAGGAQNWQLQASLTNVVGDLPVFARLTPTPAAAAANFAAPAPIVTEADRTMYQASLGVGKANASGELSVYIDDNPSVRQGIANGWNLRNWYDGVGFAEATVLTLQVNTATGAVSILNGETTGFDVNYYEIRSAAGTLNFASWNSFDDQEGSDPVGTGWDETGGSGANILSEVNLLGMKSFAPTNSANLGNAFSVGGAQDLTFAYGVLGNNVLQAGFVEYITGPAGVPGDYNQNNVVDAADYVVWRNSVGPGSLPNEGGISPGTVDQADYNFWRSRFGMTSGAGAGSAVGTAAIPEPSAAALVALVSVLLGSRSPKRMNRAE